MSYARPIEELHSKVSPEVRANAVKVVKEISHSDMGLFFMVFGAYCGPEEKSMMPGGGEEPPTDPPTPPDPEKDDP